MVQYGGTATRTDDFEGPETVHVRANREATLKIGAVDDDVYDPDETIEIMLLLDGMPLGDTQTVTIIDNDEAPTTDAPTITEIEFTSDPGTDDTYAIDDVIDVTVTFSAAVTVDTSGGTPNLALTVGEETREANFDSGSGTTGLVFKYTVVEGEEATDGVAVEAGTIALNGGTIQAGTTDAMLTYVAEAANAEHKVDGIRPTVGIAEVTVDGTHILLIFAEGLDISGYSAITFSDFGVTADGNSITVDSLRTTVEFGEIDVITLVDLSPAITHGQVVTVSYADPTTGDDTAGVLEDAAGNDVVSFTTGSGGVPAVVNNVPATPPGPPQNVVAEAFTGRVTLDWDAPASDGGSPITHYEYRLKRGTGSFEDWEQAETKSSIHELGDDGTSLVFRHTYLRTDETFTYEVRAVSANGPGAGAAADAIMTAPASRMRVELAEVRVSEGAGTVTVNAVLEIPDGWGPYDRDGDLDFSFVSASDTASPGEDYPATSAEFSFGVGDFTEVAGRWIATTGGEVEILDDRLDEDDESFTLKLERGGNTPAWIPTPTSDHITTVVIEDDDELMWTVTAAPAVIAEDGGVSTVTVRTNDVEFPADQTITLTLGTETNAATPGTDFTLADSDGAALSSPYTLTLPIGEVEVTATITGVDDNLADENETVTITALLGTDQIGETATVTIMSDAVLEPVVPAVVSNLAFTSAPSNGTDYLPGETVQVTVTFDKAVTVATSGGTPALPLTIGAATHSATYASGTGSTELVFAYEVGQEDVDTDGIAIEANTLTDGGGAITSADGSGAAVLDHAAVAAESGHKVKDRPYITALDITSEPGADGYYGLEDQIVVSVTFSELVYAATGLTGSIRIDVPETGNNPNQNLIFFDDDGNVNLMTLRLGRTVQDFQHDSDGVVVLSIGSHDVSDADDRSKPAYVHWPEDAAVPGPQGGRHPPDAGRRGDLGRRRRDPPHLRRAAVHHHRGRGRLRGHGGGRGPRGEQRRRERRHADADPRQRGDGRGGGERDLQRSDDGRRHERHPGRDRRQRRRGTSPRMVVNTVPTLVNNPPAFTSADGVLGGREPDRRRDGGGHR